MDIDDIRARMKERNLSVRQVAAEIGMDENKLTKSLGSAGRRLQVAEVDKLRRLLEGEDAVRYLPLIGDVTAGNWRAAIANPVGSVPSFDRHAPARAFALTVSGDSMDLEVADGGTVVVDPDDRDLYPGRLYVVENEDGDTTFKEYQTNPSRLIPRSTNPAHQQIAVGSQRFSIVGRVIWVAGRR